jgi:hypothetical protein
MYDKIKRRKYLKIKLLDIYFKIRIIFIDVNNFDSITTFLISEL